MSYIGTSFFFSSHAPIVLLLMIFLLGQFFFSSITETMLYNTLPQFFPKLCLDFIIVIIILIAVLLQSNYFHSKWHVIYSLQYLNSIIFMFAYYYLLQHNNKIHDFQRFIVSYIAYFVLFVEFVYAVV